MAETPVGQRLKFLIAELSLDIRGFSKALDVSETTVRNYFNRGSKPNAEFFEKLSNSFEGVNLNWLLSGKGEPFLPGKQPAQNISTTKGKGNIVGQNITTAIGNVTLDDCKRELVSTQKEVEHLKQQLELKDALLAAKEEMLVLLRGSRDRPN